MPDDDEPDIDRPEGDAPVEDELDENEPQPPRPGMDPDLFGIHLGHRGVRPDEVDPRDLEPPPRARPAARTLTDRLASAAADRDDASTAAKDEESDADE
jgi:hypothetical protein